LDQGEWVTELKEADWPFVVQRCAALLTEQSKDLRLAVWLTEAAAKQHKLRGLGEAFRVLAGLCRTYWDLGLHPLSDGDDHDQRVGNLAWILGRVPTLVREMPMTEGAGYSTIDFETARKQANMPEHQRPSDAPKLTDMEAARSRNSARFREQFAADARYCMDALRELEEVSDMRLGADSPGFATARDAVQVMLDAMPSHAAVTSNVVSIDTAVEHVQAVANGAPAVTMAPIQQGVNTRAQALSQLREIASFFRRTEPHSPVSYYADKAADAGDQDLHTWLRSVVKDSGSLSHIEELLGIQSN
jgi:type VI secretion system protein ImpA